MDVSAVKKIGVKNFDSIFFTPKTALGKFHARQAFHDLTEYFSITKLAASRRILSVDSP
jgi:hypothetical protein